MLFNRKFMSKTLHICIFACCVASLRGSLEATMATKVISGALVWFSLSVRPETFHIPRHSQEDGSMSMSWWKPLLINQHLVHLPISIHQSSVHLFLRGSTLNLSHAFTVLYSPEFLLCLPNPFWLYLYLLIVCNWFFSVCKRTLKTDFQQTNLWYVRYILCLNSVEGSPVD